MSTKAQAQTRLNVVDALRGLAVVFMIPLHTSHGWIRPELRTGNLWHAIQFFGGMAAPIFLSLAGVSLGLRWAADAQHDRHPRYRSDLARALQLVVLGYGLRLQMWIIDGSGYLKREHYLTEGLLLGGYALAYSAAGLLTRAPRAALFRAGLAAALIISGFAQVALWVPVRLSGLFRVDVLQCIGASLCVVITLGAARGPAFARPAFYVVAGSVIAWLTVWTRAWVPGPLPEGLAAYFGQWTPSDGRAIVGLFPLFPWLAYAFIGTALGLHWARAAQRNESELSIVALCACGACLALLSSESMPHVFHLLARQPWLTQPMRVLYRVSLLLVFAGVALASSRPQSPIRQALDVFGRSSLLIYWVHLEFAFGAVTAHFTKALDFATWAKGTALLIWVMLLLAYARVHVPNLRARLPWVTSALDSRPPAA